MLALAFVANRAKWMRRAEGEALSSSACVEVASSSVVEAPLIKGGNVMEIIMEEARVVLGDYI